MLPSQIKMRFLIASSLCSCSSQFSYSMARYSPQTATLTASEEVWLVVPHTTLVPQTTELPQTTEVPQITEDPFTKALVPQTTEVPQITELDRKSTRLNSSHANISYA